MYPKKIGLQSYYATTISIMGKLLYIPGVVIEYYRLCGKLMC